MAFLTISRVKECATRELARMGSKVRLERIYERVLSVPTNHVIMFGYHIPHPTVHEDTLGELIEFYLCEPPRGPRGSRIRA